MKKYIAIIILGLLFNKIQAQESFEGKIKFKTEIETEDNAPKDFKKKLENKYGDSLDVYYSKKGNLKRKYLNSGEFGNDYQLFFPENGSIYFCKKNITQIDSGTVTINSLKLVSKNKIASEKIMGLDCECYQYIGLTTTANKKVEITYCFSLLSPKINSILFTKHIDFFLSDFYQTSERPYLKFSLKTQSFRLTNTAIELTEMPIDSKTFQIIK